MVRKLIIVGIVIGAILVIAGTVHALTFDPFRDDVLDGSEFIAPPLTSDNLVILSCPSGYSESHIDVFGKDVFGKNTFDAIPICASNSGIGILRCNEEIINSKGLIEVVKCVVIP